jgi:hypothetical protein
MLLCYCGEAAAGDFLRSGNSVQLQKTLFAGRREGGIVPLIQPTSRKEEE